MRSKEDAMMVKYNVSQIKHVLSRVLSLKRANLTSITGALHRHWFRFLYSIY
jgi:hypothetical protein